MLSCEEYRRWEGLSGPRLSMSASVTGCSADDDDDIEQESKLLGNNSGVETLCNSIWGWLILLWGVFPSLGVVIDRREGELGFGFFSNTGEFKMATFFGRIPLFGSGGGEGQGESYGNPTPCEVGVAWELRAESNCVVRVDSINILCTFRLLEGLRFGLLRMNDDTSTMTDSLLFVMSAAVGGNNLFSEGNLAALCALARAMGGGSVAAREERWSPAPMEWERGRRPPPAEYLNVNSMGNKYNFIQVAVQITHVSLINWSLMKFPKNLMRSEQLFHNA